MTDAAGDRPVILVNPRLKVRRRLTLLISLLTLSLCMCLGVVFLLKVTISCMYDVLLI